MDHKWRGPFEINKCLGKGLYSLKSCSSDKTLNRVHGIHLKPYLSPLSSSGTDRHKVAIALVNPLNIDMLSFY